MAASRGTGWQYGVSPLMAGCARWSGLVRSHLSPLLYLFLWRLLTRI